MLKAQDVVTAVRLAIPTDHAWTYPELAAALRMSASEAHAAVKRAAKSGLVDEDKRVARRSSLLEFLLHGVRYMLPPVWTEVTRGIRTSYATKPLSDSITSSDLPPVWPHPEGDTRGQGLQPIYRSVPDAALRDPEFHEWLALVDAMRAGRAREKELAAAILKKRLS